MQAYKQINQGHSVSNVLCLRYSIKNSEVIQEEAWFLQLCAILHFSFSFERVFRFFKKEENCFLLFHSKIVLKYITWEKQVSFKVESIKDHNILCYSLGSYVRCYFFKTKFTFGVCVCVCVKRSKSLGGSGRQFSFTFFNQLFVVQLLSHV